MMLVVENKFPEWYQTAEEMQKARDMGVKYKKNNENKEGDSLTSDKNLAKYEEYRKLYADARRNHKTRLEKWDEYVRVGCMEKSMQEKEGCQGSKSKPKGRGKTGPREDRSYYLNLAGTIDWNEEE